MAVLIECPACEEQFQVQSQPENSIFCPACNKSFIPSGAVQRREVTLESSTSSSLADAVSQSLDPPSSRFRSEQSTSTSSQTTPPEIRSTPNNGQGSEKQLDSSRDSETNSFRMEAAPSDVASSAQAEFRPAGRVARRSRTGPWVVWLMGVIGVVAIFGVLYITVDQLSRNRASAEEKNDNQPGEEVNNGQSTEPINDSTEAQKKNAREAVADPSSAGLAPTEEELPETFSIPEYRKIWQRVYSYVVKLDVATPAGNREATGLIIDSQGWVATSLSAIRNATSVRVTLASRELDKGPAWREKTDESFGVISTNEKLDLAIIAVNRDLVLNLTDVEFGTQSRVVGGQWVLTARTPPQGKRLWFKESRVDRRANFTKLGPDLQNLVNQRGLDQDYRLLWIVHSGIQSMQSLGSPIFDNEGKVLGINIGLESRERNESFSVPIQYVLELRARSSNDPLPFTAVPTSKAGAELTTNPVPNVTLDSATEEVKQLQLSYETCRDFQFVARDNDEIESLERFAQRLGTVNAMLGDEGLDFDQREVIEEELDEILSLVEKSFANFPLQETRRIRDMNDMMFMTELEAPTPLVLVGSVQNNPALSQRFRGQACARLRIHGTDKEIFIPLDDESPLFKPGGIWLVAGTLHPKTVWNARDGDEAFNAIHFQMEGGWEGAGF